MEMGLICAVLGSLNYGQALDTLRTATMVARDHPQSPGASEALAWLTKIFPEAAKSAAEVVARS